MKRVLSAVVCSLVESDLDSDDVCETLVERLPEFPGQASECSLQ
jgi:hypothetical protein